MLTLIRMIKEMLFRKPSEFKDRLPIRGEIEIILKDKDGNIKEHRKIHNIVTTVGKAHIADQMADGGEAAMSHMAIGTGSGGGVGSTTLAVELDRNALTSATQGAGGDANKVTYTASWAAGDGTGTITEYGIFNNASGGTLLAYKEDTALPKGASDTLQVNWTIIFGS